MKQKVLLLKDVESLGRSGEVAVVKAGFSRNYLIPQKLAVVADQRTLRMQEKLRKERAIQAEKDRKEAEVLAQSLENIALTIRVKIDPEGKLYGSVGVSDILALLEEKGVQGMGKKSIQLPKPLKSLGTFTLSLKLKEGVPAKVQLHIQPEEEKKQPTTKKQEVIKKEQEERLQEYESMAEEAKEEE